MGSTTGYDFTGWATRSNIRCSDGRIIDENAFKHYDGMTVPLVWNHDHSEPENVLGHADLQYKPGGMYAFCKFNDTQNGEVSKVLVKHGDIVSLSIYANHLKERGHNVMHGDICEVSLVHKGANPGAYIENVLIHGDNQDEEAIIYSGEPIEMAEVLAHSNEEEHAEEPKKEEAAMLVHADEEAPKKEEKKEDGEEKTLKDVFDTMNEEQQTCCYAMVGLALEENGGGADKKEGEKEMKHNAFDQTTDRREEPHISHADQGEILGLAKNAQVATWKNALDIWCDNNDMAHSADPVGGFVQDPSVDGNVSWLFPEYKDIKPGAPETLTNDQSWVGGVLAKVHKNPFSRIRTRQVDIRNLDGTMNALRAKGYPEKGAQKKISGNFKLARRTTDPQTVYVRNSLHKDDITDITDFDYVQYLYNIDKMMLDEELATAIMFGDGRDEADEDKIHEEHIRPIWTDDDLYTIHKDVDIAGARASLQGSNTTANFGDNYIYAEAIITAMLYAREKFKGSGQPDLYCAPHLINIMLLARDLNGRRIYSSVSELASALNVGTIHTVEQMENKTREVTEGSGAQTVTKTKKLLALVCNLNDYALGCTKGGQVSHFTQFDIDFNQEKSLIETRVSGALTRLYSAIALEEDVTENP